MFSAFISILVLGLIIFFTSKVIEILNIIGIFKNLKTEMVLSNKMLYIINFEECSDDTRTSVTKFLSEY